MKISLRWWLLCIETGLSHKSRLLSVQCTVTVSVRVALKKEALGKSADVLLHIFIFETKDHANGNVQ